MIVPLLTTLLLVISLPEALADTDSAQSINFTSIQVEPEPASAWQLVPEPQVNEEFCGQDDLFTTTTGASLAFNFSGRPSILCTIVLHAQQIIQATVLRSVHRGILPSQENSPSLSMAPLWTL